MPETKIKLQSHNNSSLEFTPTHDGYLVFCTIYYMFAVYKRKGKQQHSFSFFFQHTRHALPDSDATRMDQKLRRRRVCEKLALVPGKLDHATVAAYSIADRKKSLQAYSGRGFLYINAVYNFAHCSSTVIYNMGFRKIQF